MSVLCGVCSSIRYCLLWFFLMTLSAPKATLRLYGTVSTKGYFTALSIPKDTLRHCQYRRLLYGTVGTESYFTALSVPKDTLRHFQYRRTLYGTVSTEGYFTALSVPKVTLRHCRYQRLLHGTVGTESYSASIISMFHIGNVPLVFDGIC